MEHKKSSTHSSQLDLFRLLLVFGIVYVHALDTTLLYYPLFDFSQTGSPEWNRAFIEKFISQGIVRPCVPLLFVIAGWLYFRTLSRSLKAFAAKIQTRIRTLFIPFILWNLWVLIVFAILQNISFSKLFFVSPANDVLGFNVGEFFAAILGIGRPPIAYQFWFIRDLMLLVLLAPIFDFLLFRSILFGRFALFICFALWITGAWPLYAPGIEAVFFFSLGGVLATRKKNIFDYGVFNAWSVCAFLILISLSLLFNGSVLPAVASKLLILTGCLVWIGASNSLYASAALRDRLLGYASSSFFVFAFHEPILTASKKLLAYISAGGFPVPPNVGYYLIPPAVVFLSIGVHRGMLAVTPRLASVLTGGRGE